MSNNNLSSVMKVQSYLKNGMNLKKLFVFFIIICIPIIINGQSKKEFRTIVIKEDESFSSNTISLFSGDLSYIQINDKQLYAWWGIPKLSYDEGSNSYQLVIDGFLEDNRYIRKQISENGIFSIALYDNETSYKNGRPSASYDNIYEHFLIGSDTLIWEDFAPFFHVNSADIISINNDGTLTIKINYFQLRKGVETLGGDIAYLFFYYYNNQTKLESEDDIKFKLNKEKKNSNGKFIEYTLTAKIKCPQIFDELVIRESLYKLSYCLDLKDKNRSSLQAKTTATYINATPNKLDFTSNGGTKTISVYTDGSSYDVSLLPSWCSVTNKTSSSFQIVCQANTGNVRSDWFKVKSGEKEQRIDVEQAKGVTTPSAEIEKIWVEHNVKQWQQNVYYPYNSYSVNGMKIHIKFSTSNMLYKQGAVTAWFYYGNGEKLILTAHNGAYTTPEKQVAVAEKFTPPYENTTYNDLVLFLPYNAIPKLGKGSHDLKFNVGIHHGSNQIATSEYQNFTMSW